MLRAALGSTLLIQGAAYISTPRSANLAAWSTALAMLIIGLLLLIGYLTPFASFLALAASLVEGLSWVPQPVPDLLATTTAVALAAVIGAAIACLGPGAFSLDARLFGRREITIP